MGAAVLMGTGLVVAPASADAAVTSVAGSVTSSATAATPTVQQGLSAHAKRVPQQLQGHRHQSVCQQRRPGHVSCMAIRDLTTGATPATGSADGPWGYWPSDLQFAYSLPTGNGAGQTVAVVDAFDAPYIQADLNAYRARFGLPPCAAGCFTKVNQSGQASPLPARNSDWSAEIALDVEMVSAACPKCKIILVEANSTDLSDLASAEDTAAAFHPVAISNSFGGDEDSSDVYADSHFDHPGIAITASAGDSGYGVQYPAASPDVVAVGGTSLYPAYGPARGYTETVWGDETADYTDPSYGDGTGSGCSQYEPKPAWQTDTGCANRTVADVSAVADPATGVAVYDTSSGYCAQDGGWCVLGGTSASSPLVAGMFALAGSSGQAYPAATLYQNRRGLNDVVSGSNRTNLTGNTCTVTYLCAAAGSYDGPTGLGTPNGIAAFGRRNSAAGAYTAVPPHRILDTRNGLGRSQAETPLRSHTDTTVTVAGAAGVPTDASGVVLNVTVTQPTSAGFLTVHPAGGAVPNASNVNFVAGQTVPNEVMVSLRGGAIGLYDFQTVSNGTTHVVVDVSGYYVGSGSTAGTFVPLAQPYRMLDTRTAGGGAKPVPAGATVRLPVTGRGGLPASGVGAVVLNLTVTEPTNAGFITAYPDNGKPRPNASNVNYVRGQTVPNLAVVPVGANGVVDLYNFELNNGAAHLVADVFGYFVSGSPAPSGTYGAVTPGRILDTRTGTGAAKAPVRGGSVLRLKVTGQYGVPASGVSAVVLNVTVTQPGYGGFITVYPDGQPIPNASNLNFVAGQTVPNLVVVPVPANGYVDLYDFENSAGSVHLVADISGYFVSGS